jgi:hypothetical protein
MCAGPPVMVVVAAAMVANGHATPKTQIWSETARLADLAACLLPDPLVVARVRLCTPVQRC